MSEKVKDEYLARIKELKKQLSDGNLPLGLFIVSIFVVGMRAGASLGRGGLTLGESDELQAEVTNTTLTPPQS